MLTVFTLATNLIAYFPLTLTRLTLLLRISETDKVLVVRVHVGELYVNLQSHKCIDMNTKSTLTLILQVQGPISHLQHELVLSLLFILTEGVVDYPLHFVSEARITGHLQAITRNETRTQLPQPHGVIYSREIAATPLACCSTPHLLAAACVY